jgi:hypothetical protein
MREKDIKEGLADLADVAERDHEVQMARAELYKIAKYSIKLHEMLKGVSETAGLEGWVQSKITKSADYLGSVYHHLDYDMKFGEQVEEAKKPDADGDGVPDWADKTPGKDDNAGKKKGSKPKKGVVPPQFQKKNEDTYKESIANRLAKLLKEKS